MAAMAAKATTTAAQRPIVPGDILFYAGTDPISRLIARGTGPGACSHCEIVERVEVVSGMVVSIAALGVRRGIVRHNAPLPAYRVAHTGARLTPSGCAAGLGFLARRVGSRYGVLDIAADVVRALLPKRWADGAPFLVAPSTLDCSHLATDFLIEAGYALPDAFLLAPQTVSPNSLLRTLAAQGVEVDA